jgi:hypothetical protein
VLALLVVNLALVGRRYDGAEALVGCVLGAINHIRAVYLDQRKGQPSHPDWATDSCEKSDQPAFLQRLPITYLIVESVLLAKGAFQ